jgi:hypothetical protein
VSRFEQLCREDEQGTIAKQQQQRFVELRGHRALTAIADLRARRAHRARSIADCQEAESSGRNRRCIERSSGAGVPSRRPSDDYRCGLGGSPAPQTVSRGAELPLRRCGDNVRRKARRDRSMSSVRSSTACSTPSRAAGAP